MTNGGVSSISHMQEYLDDKSQHANIPQVAEINLSSTSNIHLALDRVK